jgi:hypothetical protein
MLAGVLARALAGPSAKSFDALLALRISFSIEWSDHEVTFDQMPPLQLAAPAVDTQGNDETASIGPDARSGATLWRASSATKSSVRLHWLLFVPVSWLALGLAPGTARADTVATTSAPMPAPTLPPALPADGRPAGPAGQAGQSGQMAASTSVSPSGAAAADKKADSPRRYELAGFPIIGGNSDIGFQFGAAATLTRFYDDAFPYLWNIDLLLSASLKDDDTGLRLVQQSHVLRLDAPDLLDNHLRLDTRASYQRTIDAGYYGIGNAAAVTPGSKPEHYEYLQNEARIRAIARVHTKTPLDIAFGASIRYEAPQAYPGSQLASDLGTPNDVTAIGGSSTLLGGIAAGVMYDTRDSEFVTRKGIFYQVGIGATAGTEDRIAYGNTSIVLAHYAPLGPYFVFASRFIASWQFGRVPFYDLAQGGTFEPQYLLGGDSGVRGVPQGRYAGLVKAIANIEIRGTPFPRFNLLGQSLRIGTTTFLDTGRVWSDYNVISQTDGTTINLKYGIGGGVFLQWGQAAIFRVEVAYSPDAVSENPNLPLGIYVSDGLMF